MRAQDPLSRARPARSAATPGGSVLAADAREPRRPFRLSRARSRRRSSASTGSGSGRRPANIRHSRPRSASHDRGAATRASPLASFARVPDAIVVGSGPNGLAAAIVAGAGGPLGARARGGRDRRRRHAHGRADAARVPPRRLLGDPSAGARLAVLADAAARGARPRVDPPAGAARAPVRRRHGGACSSARSRHDRGGLGADGAAYRRPDAAARRATPTTLLGEHPRPAARPRHPLALARFGLAAVLPGDEPGTAAVRRRARARRSSPGLRGALDAAARRARRAPRSGSCSALLGHHVGWPLPQRRLAARSPMRWSPTCARSAARSRPAGAVDSLDELPPATPCCSTSRRASCSGSPATGCRPRYRRAACSGFRYGPGVFKLDWALDGPIPWSAPECARAATVHLGGRSRRSPRRRPAVAAAGTPSGPTCCSPSRASSTRRGRRPASTPPGPTATCRTDRTST